MARATALIPAAGCGARVGADRNKVLLPLLDVPVLVWTLRIFESLPEVTEVVVIVSPGDRADVHQLIERHALTVSDVVIGGDRRQDSVYNGLFGTHASGDLILVHDAARPLASPYLMAQVLQEADSKGASIAAIPVTDTIVRGDSAGNAIEIVPRDRLWHVQTPQAFRADLLREAYLRARAEGWEATDDASLVRRLGHSVAIVPGERRNIKLTTKEDFTLAEGLLSLGN